MQLLNEGDETSTCVLCVSNYCVTPLRLHQSLFLITAAFTAAFAAAFTAAFTAALVLVVGVAVILVDGVAVILVAGHVMIVR